MRFRLDVESPVDDDSRSADLRSRFWPCAAMRWGTINRRIIMNGILFIATLNSMANLDSFTGHRLANRKRVARSNYGPLDCHKQRKVASFRKNRRILGSFGRL